LKFERFEVVVDDQPPRTLKSYSLLVGNAGWLPGAISMMPDARLDDSRLDMAAIGPRKIWNWVDFIGRITWQNIVVRPLSLGRKWLDATANVKTSGKFQGPENLNHAEKSDPAANRR
jgi:diacylglycerol kinase (ATP)